MAWLLGGMAWLLWWLGLYLVGRESRTPLLRAVGGVLALTAVAMVLDGLVPRLVLPVGSRRGPLLLALLAGGVALRHAPRPVRPSRATTLVAGSALVALASAVTLLFLPHAVLWIAIGSALLALGAAVAWLDAFEQGEALWPDMLRSADYSLFLSLIFGGQVALAIRWLERPPSGLWLLLVATLATAVAVQVFAGTVARLVERVAFFRAPPLRAERATLRAAADALPRRADPHPLLADPTRLAHQTRRALSHYGDLPKLVGSSLIHLPLIDARLAERGIPDNPLARSQLLKELLAESIARLRPSAAPFGTTDEWRHYNALHFPYVVGLKPYSRRATHEGLDQAEQAALDWFRSQVPPRTLYNWQSAAAELVAQDLRAQHAALVAAHP